MLYFLAGTKPLTYGVTNGTRFHAVANAIDFRDLVFNRLIERSIRHKPRREHHGIGFYRPFFTIFSGYDDALRADTVVPDLTEQGDAFVQKSTEEKVTVAGADVGRHLGATSHHRNLLTLVSQEFGRFTPHQLTANYGHLLANLDLPFQNVSRLDGLSFVQSRKYQG